MAFCSKCGLEVNDNADVCLNCGRFLNTVSCSKNDKGGFGWGVLGFFIPVAGLTLWLVWKDYLPKRAKSVGIGALVSAIAYVAYLAFVIVVYLLIIMSYLFAM